MSTTQFGAGSDRKQLMIASQSHQVKVAKRDMKEMLGSEKKHEYTAHEVRLLSIMNRLIPYADEYLGDRTDVEWNIHIDGEMEQLDAIALANGMIVFSPSFLDVKHLNDADYAFLIAHEMAHVIRQHHREIASWRYIVSPALMATSLATTGVTSIAGSTLKDLYGITYRKETEREADRIGLEIMTKAGYDPGRAIDAFIKIEPKYRQQHPIASKMPSILQAHPPFKARVADLKRLMPQMRKLQYEYRNKVVLPKSAPIKPIYGELELSPLRVESLPNL